MATIIVIIDLTIVFSFPLKSPLLTFLIYYTINFNFLSNKK